MCEANRCPEERENEAAYRRDNFCVFLFENYFAVRWNDQFLSEHFIAACRATDTSADPLIGRANGSTSMYAPGLVTELLNIELAQALCEYLE